MPLAADDSNTDHTCAVCQASFTRKTHLTRHVRAHLNQRTYGCTLCGRATFTRSDLLARHAKRCSLNPGGLPNSRRKACQTCIQRKVKCDLQTPCAKCTARGDECVYQSRPAVDKEGECDLSAVDADADAALGVLDEPSLASVPEQESGPSVDFVDPSLDPNLALFMNGLSDSMTPFSTTSETLVPAPTPSVLPGPSLVPADASDSTQTSEYTHQDLLLSSQLVPRPATFQSDSSVDLNTPFPDDFFSQPDNVTLPPFPEIMTGYAPPFVPRPLPPAAEPDTDVYPPETDSYLVHFFASHCRQYPFLHVPTWSQCVAHPLLVQAMRACGALYVAGNDAVGLAADQFILDTIRSGMRQQIFRAFVQTPANDVDTQAALILAFASVQNLGLFHRCPQERSVSAAYHGMLVTMVRTSALQTFLDSWELPPVESLGTWHAWTSWSRYETVKRTLLLIYLHDSLMSVFHSLPPSFGESELDLRLPCDEELWEAPNAHQWAQLLPLSSHIASPSFYPAALQVSLQGHSLNAVVTNMRSPLSAAVPVPLNPFSSFCVIHALLRAIHLAKSTDFEAHLSIQHALTQWYIGRLSAASGAGASVSSSSSGAKLNFTSTALPLYWMAQLTHGNISPTTPSMGQTRFNTIKSWLRDFFSVLRDAGEVAVGVGLAGVPDTSTASAFVEEMEDADVVKNKAEAGLLDWVPR